MTNLINSQPLPQAPTISSTNQLLGSQQPAPMPQLILASGHMIQGIQGAQLLIPTSQGNTKIFICQNFYSFSIIFEYYYGYYPFAFTNY